MPGSARGGTVEFDNLGSRPTDRLRLS